MVASISSSGTLISHRNPITHPQLEHAWEAPSTDTLHNQTYQQERLSTAKPSFALQPPPHTHPTSMPGANSLHTQCNCGSSGMLVASERS